MRRRTLFKDKQSGLQVDRLPDGKHIEISIPSVGDVVVKARLGYTSSGILSAVIYRWKVATVRRVVQERATDNSEL